MLAELPTRAEREPVLQTGEGGDETTAIDAAAETAVVHRLEQLDEEFTLVSRSSASGFGSGGWRVVCDPIDGSLNAKRDIPSSRSRSRSRRRDDGRRRLWLRLRLRSGEEWTAERGGGALAGRRLGAVKPKDEIEILSFEATTTAEVAERAPRWSAAPTGYGSWARLALSPCHLAGRVDAVCLLKPARSVDIAAGQLLVRECGLAIDLFEDPPFEAAPLDLVGRSRVVAAGDRRAVPRTLETALTA